MDWQWIDTAAGFIVGYFVGMIAVTVGYFAGMLREGK